MRGRPRTRQYKKPCKILCEELVDVGVEECIKECIKRLPRIMERWEKAGVLNAS